MTTPSRRPITPFTARLLALYRGEPPQSVLERAMRMLAGADGHLRPDGQIKTDSLGRAARGRT